MIGVSTNAADATLLAGDGTAARDPTASIAFYTRNSLCAFCCLPPR